ncbi:MAG: NUDIX domain-containing protein [Flavobacteriales bacterium]|jgi:ADP-ribose pyrophosphatase YjhB (NUDIX family)|nr:NUDIX domain-containing protein [Flavobacteriales bacterium]MBT6746730.1 NUDIX domain-containing protein [Flavobacteriales bacterium]
MATPSNFNIRVYGLLFNEQGDVLVSDEERFGNRFTKFPGGGLEFGEGLTDCLKREYIEELNQNIEVINHFYTTDFYQKSAFDNQDQLISIYYVVKPIGVVNFKISKNPFDFNRKSAVFQSFRFIPVKTLSENNFTFPIDKHIARLIKDTFTK